MIHSFIANFNIRVSLGQEDVFDLSGETVLTILSDKCIVKTKPIVICADPFLYTESKRLFLFYEEQKGYYDNGIIKMISSENLIDWSTPVTVLKEPFHLSFPFVFNDLDVSYMIPETNQDKSIRLYSATSAEFDSWCFKRKLIDDGNRYVDSSVIRVDGIYFLFTTQIKNNQYYQLLFYSKSLADEFVLHPKSPIHTGKDYARNGGSIFIHKGEMFRPVQHCSTGYGNQLSVFKVELINEKEYNESLFKREIFDAKIPFYRYGGHHFNSAIFNGKLIIATDARKPFWNLFRPFTWLIHKIK